MPMNPDEIPLDPRDLLQRVARIDSNLYSRVLAEAQRDHLIEMIHNYEKRQQMPREVPSGPLTTAKQKHKANSEEDVA